MWLQEAYLKAGNTDAGDQFGRSVSLSADGNTLAVGARNERSISRAIGRDEDNDNNDAENAGAVYVFVYMDTEWSQQAYLKSDNASPHDLFGFSVSISVDGNTLAVGARGERSNARGINGDKENDTATNAGAAYVFTRSGITWTQQAYLKVSNTDESDGFGFSVSLSANGNTLAVGANGEGSGAIGIGGNQYNGRTSGASGAVYTFARSGENWSQQAYIKASNTGGADAFGYSVALSADGGTLAVSAYQEDSNATDVNGEDQANNRARNAGAVYLY